MIEQKFKMDDAPLNKFHMKITALTFGSNFSDGYALGIIGVALTLLSPQMELNSMWVGLIGSSALIGLFFGSLVLGGLSDRIGRQKIYLLNFLLVTIASLLQLFVDSPAELLILRLLIGFALGGDYAVGSTLLAEFAPRKYRGFLLASLNVLWTVGYVCATIVGYYLGQSGPESWRWMLASAAIPAFIVLILRIGTPESPQWLISMGRIDEARHIVKKYIGPNAEIDETVIETQYKNGFRALFNKKFRKRTAFGSLFYVCIVIPYFAIYTFLPSILNSMGLAENFTVDLWLNIFLILGSVAGLWLMEKFSRRGFTISTFAILTVCLLMLSIFHEPKILVIPIFLAFTFIISANSNLTLTYPAELFPTEIRASGVGFVTAFSRIGSAIGTFLLPLSMNTIGLDASMIGMTAILLIGTIISIAWAPETKSLSLSEASNPFNEASNSNSNLNPLNHKKIN
ncbi:Inner membrane metabolite transport protein YgcS [Peribacillus sp. Bi96]|uniref:MFS transporter n=2 Tax=unclassified Peribacillus TaxID=2675266 RepID=UPI001D1E1166|nr:MFS transporter [Peribacillus sp. Bi96]CAH0307769.1 Inner membrane metabolite transport protein YgcS [Peribacillus sp. Bi96]